MADYSTIARPYAKAAFEFAQASNALAVWGDNLAALAQAADNPDLAALLGDPRVTTAKLTELLTGLLGDSLDAAGRNFVALLADNRRLAALPAIAAQFEALRAEAEQRVDVELITAAPAEEAQEQRIAEQLKQRLGKDVRLHSKVDESLLGGAVVRAGDLVIDSSVKGKLERLANEIAH